MARPTNPLSLRSQIRFACLAVMAATKTHADADSIIAQLGKMAKSKKRAKGQESPAATLNVQISQQRTIILDQLPLKVELLGGKGRHDLEAIAALDADMATKPVQNAVAKLLAAAAAADKAALAAKPKKDAAKPKKAAAKKRTAKKPAAVETTVEQGNVAA